MYTSLVMHPFPPLFYAAFPPPLKVRGLFGVASAQLERFERRELEAALGEWPDLFLKCPDFCSEEHLFL